MVTPATIEPDITAAEIIPTTAFALMSAFISFPFLVLRPLGLMIRVENGSFPGRTLAAFDGVKR